MIDLPVRRISLVSGCLASGLIFVPQDIVALGNVGMGHHYDRTSEKERKCFEWVCAHVTYCNYDDRWAAGATNNNFMMPIILPIITSPQAGQLQQSESAP